MKMRRVLLIPIAFLLLVNARLGAAADGPLQVLPLPVGWKLEYQGTSEPVLYSVTLPEGTGILMFSRWPASEKAEDIPAWVQKIADGFLREAKKEPEFPLTSENYVIEQFAGDHCKGSYAIFKIKTTGDVQTIFMMSVDGLIWSGQFTGNSGDWMRALELLKTIKKSG